MKTPKETAQAVADAALDKLRAALSEQQKLSAELKVARRDFQDWSSPVVARERLLNDAVKRVSEAFKAWSTAQKAVEP